MVGLVIVSHSAGLAAGVAELARGMAGDEARIEAVGGMDAPGRPLGTDPMGVAAAIERVYSDDGVVVLMDLGSAVLSAEMALDLAPEGMRARVALCEAPLVEGAVSAAVQAGLGAPLEVVLAEARASLGPKAEHLGIVPASSAVARPGPDGATDEGPRETVRVIVPNALGLHARPAAKLVRLAAGFPDSRLTVFNITKDKGPSSALSVNAVATIAASRGDELEFSAFGAAAAEALSAVAAFAADNFGDPVDIAAPEPRGPEAVARAPGGSEHGLRGVPASRGLAIGPAFRYAPAVPVPTAGRTDDPERDWKALEAALVSARASIAAIRDGLRARGSSPEADIMDAHRAMLDDPAILGPARQRVFGGRLGAAAAWSESCGLIADAYRALDDEYLRARASDVEDVRDRVLSLLLGPGPVPLPRSPSVLVAEELSPSETAGLDPAMVLAVCTARGGASSHASILARGLGIPSVAGLGARVLDVPDGTELLVDGDSGIVVAAPGPEESRAFARRVASRTEATRRDIAESSGPTTTADGVSMEVLANVGSVADAAAAAKAGAGGVGLLRTEFAFSGRTSAPTEDEQYAIYSGIAAAMGGRPVIVRTLDAGGDKPLSFLDLDGDANPFLGWRGIRVCLDEPGFFRAQLRAIVRTAALHPIKVMFPMIATKAEFVAARGLLERARAELEAEGVPVPARIEAGAMIEVPSAAVCADALATEVDFFSIGTNDLTQYAMAAERGNPRVAALADYCHPAVLRLIRAVVDAARSRGLTVGVCGEMGGDPAMAGLLVGLGVRELSMGSPSVPGMKRALRHTDSTRARALADAALGLDSASAVRALVSASERP